MGGAALTGGNFWQGAVTGLIVSTFNHVAHSMMQQDPIKQPWDTNGDGILQKSEADNWGLNGGGDITVDGNKIDLNGFNPAKLHYNKASKSYIYQTIDMFKDLPNETASTYGGSSFKFIKGKWQMQSQEYHYDLRPWNSWENIRRNILTILGKPINTIQIPYGVMPSGGHEFNKFYINIKY